MQKDKKPRPKSGKSKVVMVSGGFDPLHIGHIRLFKDAKKLGSRLVVVLNNDHWIRQKKGVEFMTDKERKEIIEAIVEVDKVILTGHKKNTNDISVCKELRKVRRHVLANGGDRNANNIPEYDVCRELGIEMAFNVGGEKMQSSSELLRNYLVKNGHR